MKKGARALTQSDSHELANQLLFATDLHGIASNMVMRQTAQLYVYKDGNAQR